MTDQAGYHGLEVVDKLTEMLIELDANALAFTDANVHAIHTVFEQLHPVDRDETVFQQQVGDNPQMGNLKITRMNSVIPGVDSTKR